MASKQVMPGNRVIPIFVGFLFLFFSFVVLPAPNIWTAILGILGILIGLLTVSTRYNLLLRGIYFSIAAVGALWALNFRLDGFVVLITFLIGAYEYLSRYNKMDKRSEKKQISVEEYLKGV